MTIHALYVAVSEYPDGINDLPGCTNDLAVIQQFFEDYARINEVNYAPTVLHNETATRPNLIEAFTRFDAAEEEDICLFYFSGHGSQVPAPREFWDQEPDRKCEALVLADYGQKGSGFLVDKELSYLLHEHTKTAAHVLLLVDSCHSGTISRSVGLPRTTALNVHNLRFTDFLGHESYRVEGSGRRPPVRPHFTLAACRPEQVAMEMPLRENKSHGLFSHFLVETMSAVSLGELSYRELADRVKVRVKNKYKKQDVFAEATPGLSLDTRFFGGGLLKGRNHLLHYGEGKGWFLEQGELSGLKTGDQVTILDGEEERNCSIRRIEAGRSYVATEDWLREEAAPYPIIQLEKQGDPMPVCVDAKSLSIYAGAVKERITKESATLRLVDTIKDARYVVTFLPDYGLSMVTPGEKRPLFESSKNWQNELPEFIEKLSKVATYETTLSLAPSVNILPLEQAVDIRLEQVFTDDFGDLIKTEEMPLDGTAVFAYQHHEESGELDPPKLRLKVKVRNDFPAELHVGMLFLDESFGISNEAMPVAKLQAGEEAYQTRLTGTYEDGETFTQSYFDLVLSDEIQSWGLTEITNYLKVIVSETPIELGIYEQEGIAQQEKIDDGKGMRGHRPSAPRRKRVRNRWAVKNIPLTIYRPLTAEKAASFAPDAATAPVLISHQPAGFSCEMMVLDASLSVTRSLSKKSSPPCPTQGYFLEPVSLIKSRSATAAETPIDMVQLMNVQNPRAVTASSPLRLQAGDAGVEGNIVLAYDEATKRYYPVGFPDKETNEIIVQELPPGTEEQYTRSLGSSVKLFFRKVASKYVPWLDEKRVNQLRRIEVAPDQTVTYRGDQVDKIKQAVTATEAPIAVFIHGIIGDTTASAGILRLAKMPDGSDLYSKYDVILTYDYENLNTPILTTSDLFQEDLKRVGLEAGHGKTVHLYAHSMGGLVSRGFIELKTGKEVITHLIQFGTPNGGSPYGTVAEWITPLLSRALAAGAAAHPYLRWLLALRWVANKLFETLMEMKPKSETLKLLAGSPGRGSVQYHLVNGDIGLIPDEDVEAERSFLQRITERFDWQEGVQKAFFQSPTDIAVSVESQQNISNLDVYPDAVGSDHMSYFFTPAAVRVLEGYLPGILEIESPGN